MLLAGLHAMRDWDTYTGIVQNYRMLPAGAAIFAARIIPLAQILTAALLFTIPNAGCALAASLFILFTHAIATNVARGRTHIDCGCGAGGNQNISWALVTRNLLLLALTLAILPFQSDRPLTLNALLTSTGAGIFLVLLYFATNQLMANQQQISAIANKRANA